jgi:hypothetical protein
MLAWETKKKKKKHTHTWHSCPGLSFYFPADSCFLLYSLPLSGAPSIGLVGNLGAYHL